MNNNEKLTKYWKILYIPTGVTVYISVANRAVNAFKDKNSIKWMLHSAIVDYNTYHGTTRFINKRVIGLFNDNDISISEFDIIPVYLRETDSAYLYKQTEYVGSYPIMFIQYE